MAKKAAKKRKKKGKKRAKEYEKPLKVNLSFDKTLKLLLKQKGN